MNDIKCNELNEINEWLNEWMNEMEWSEIKWNKNELKSNEWMNKYTHEMKWNAI